MSEAAGESLAVQTHLSRTPRGSAVKKKKNPEGTRTKSHPGLFPFLSFFYLKFEFDKEASQVVVLVVVMRPPGLDSVAG